MEKSNDQQGWEKLPPVPVSDELGEGVPASGTTGVAPGSTGKPAASGGLGPIASGGTTIIDISGL